MTLGRLRRMLTGTGSHAQAPDPSSAGCGGQGSLVEARAKSSLRGTHREGPGTGRDLESLEPARVPPGPPPVGSPGTHRRTATGPLARLGRRQEARLPFSRFLDEVTVRVLDPGTLEGLRGPRGHSPEPFPGQHGLRPAQETLARARSTWEQDPAQSPPSSLEATAEAAGGMGPGRAVDPRGPDAGGDEQGGRAASPSVCRASAADMEKLRLRSPWVPSCLGQPRVLQGRLARSSPSLWDSALQEQKGELRKRLSYTTHKLEKLETEFDSTRHYLEIELRRAQEELEKVTEKLRRIQSNYMTLQRVNQELEDKLYRMGQHYEEEKRALSHEIVALNSHLLEAKVTIDKLSEDNELYRKDCNLAAQLLQCSQTYGRAHKVSELPSDFQQRVSLHLEQRGCSLPSPLCRPAYADSVPACAMAQVLEKPEPASLSPRLSDASARDLAFRDAAEQPGARAPYKGDVYCSDTALYCPEERRRDRRPSGDAPVADVGFLRGQNSTDSAAEEEEEAEAAAFPAGYRREAFPGYAGSLPTSSSYSSFSATSEEKEPAAATLTASQRAAYLRGREELFGRRPPPPPPAAYDGSPRFAKAAAAAAPRDAEGAPGYARPASPYPAEAFRFPASPGPQPALMPPNLWTLRAKPGGARLAGEDARGPWRPLGVEDIGAYAYPAGAGRASPAPCGFPERFYGGAGEAAEGRASPLYAAYKADSLSEADDAPPGRRAEPCFLRAGADLGLSPSRSADPLPGYAAGDADAERLGVPLGGAASSPEPERGSRESLEPSSMEASPEMRPAARLSPQQAFARTGGSGLSRKDSLTKAQLYGTLLN